MIMEREKKKETGARGWEKGGKRRRVGGIGRRNINTEAIREGETGRVKEGGKEGRERLSSHTMAMRGLTGGSPIYLGL